MKVATITFHWATNYGAVMQAFALQKYLQKCGFDTEIIDYVPRRVSFLQKIKWLIESNKTELKREKNITSFRKRELCLSKKRYYTYEQLCKKADLYDVIVCGSDQIWNTYFTTKGEGKPTLSYFLGFADKNTRRIAYAVSFGADTVSEQYKSIVSNEIRKFDAIGVRELSGMDIAKQLGRKAELVCDPTILLEREVYDSLINDISGEVDNVFVYILHSGQTLAYNVVQVVREIYNERKIDNEFACGPYKWLYSIREAKIVVTNSFHGVVFSLLFNTEFIVVPVEGSSMNNRIVTLLEKVGLTDRIVDCTDKRIIYHKCKNSINWEVVNKKLECMRIIGQVFLKNNLSRGEIDENKST